MATFNIAALERRIAALEASHAASLRFGTVTEVDAAANSARVMLADGNGMVTMPLRVLSRRSTRDKEQCLPDIGDPVAVLFAGQGLEQGVVLGTFHSKAVPAAGQAPEVDYRVYEDGTEICYNRASHKLIARIKGDVDIDVEGRITVKATQAVSVESDQTVTVRASQAVSVESATDISLKAPTVSIAGILSVSDMDGQPGSGTLLGSYTIQQGGLTVPDADVTAGSVSVRGHTHSGVESGPSTTGAPVGG